MPHIVHLDLSNDSQEQSEVAYASGERHWLLRAMYGRDLLKAKLRKVRPDLNVNIWLEQRHFDPLLEDMVDVMGLRDWPEPKTAMARLKYVAMVMRMMRAIDDGAPLPSWRV